MRALFSLFVLLPALLLSTTFACPVKQGSYVDGLLRPTPLLRPVCGELYAAFKRSFEKRGAAWGELYEVADPKAPLAALPWLRGLEARGYGLKLSIRKGNVAQLGYASGKRRIFVSFGSVGGKPVVGIMGN